MMQALQHFYPQHQQDIQMISNYDYMFVATCLLQKVQHLKITWLG